MLTPHHVHAEPARQPVDTSHPARPGGTLPRRRPARPGRPPVMRPPLPYRALSLASWHALLNSKGAES